MSIRQLVAVKRMARTERRDSDGRVAGSDGTVTVIFSSLDSSSAQFGYVVNGDTLTLNGVAFVKGQ